MASANPAAPASASLQLLEGEGWLQAILDLHQGVRDQMPEAKRHCLLPKTEEYFRGLLTGQTGAIIGAIVDEKLVGVMAVLLADDFAAAKAKGMITAPDTDKHVTTTFGSGPAAVAQSLCVLKAYGGRGISHALIKAVVDWAKDRNIVNLFAQIAQENAVSWMRFLSYDFAIVDGWASGHARFLLRWMKADDKDKVRGSAVTSDLHSVNKDSSELPALLVVIGAMLRQGRLVMATGAEPSSAKISLLFGKM